MGLFSVFARKLPLDTARIEAAIAHLESQSSAEVRVVVERKVKKAHAPDAMSRAAQLFAELNMQDTAARNGVLIYLSLKPHYVAIIGDEGIHQHVGEAFWQQIYQQMKACCQAGDYTTAIIFAIQQVEVELAQHFPLGELDINELPNEVVIK